MLGAKTDVIRTDAKGNPIEHDTIVSGACNEARKPLNRQNGSSHMKRGYPQIAVAVITRRMILLRTGTWLISVRP
jgi:hypothetical protein